MATSINGIMPAIVSPCDDNDIFLEDKFTEQAVRLYKGGSHGLYVCGLTGDAYKLTPDERKRAAEIAVDISRKYGGHVMVHVGTLSTRDSLALAEHAAGIGAGSLAAIPPTGLSQNDLLHYYTDIAHVSGLPLFVYYVPGYTKRYSTLGEILELLQIDGVVGLKFSDWDLFLLKRILIARPETIIMNGNDEIILPALLYGAKGGIGLNYNFFPELFVKLYDAVGAGDISRALTMQNLLLKWTNILFRYGLIECLELVCRAIGIGPHVRRRPWPKVDAETEKRILAELMPVYEEIRAAVH